MAKLIDSLKTRTAMATWLETNATITLECLPEDIDPVEHFDDPRDVAFARTCDEEQWRWCIAKVTMRYGDYSATDYLGGCSYDSETAFRETSMYYTDMVHACAVDLVANLMAARETAQRIFDLASVVRPVKPERTRVLFRAVKRGAHAGKVTAVFPDLVESRGLLTCYAHVGQHSTCAPAWIRFDTRPARPAEYSKLYSELEQIGYQLEIVKRLPRG